MNDGLIPSEEAIERARENLDDCRDLAESDLPIASYAETLVSLVEDLENK